MSKELKTWKCDACAEAEGGSGLPCTLTSLLQPEVTLCPVSGEECEWQEADTRTADNRAKEAESHVADLLAEIDEMVETLREFGKHKDDCETVLCLDGTMSTTVVGCNCGLDKVKELK